jgi:hypothetical protein
MNYWAAVYTDAQAEPDVRAEIEKLGFGAFLPWYKLGTWRGDRLIVRNKTLFPRYVFFHLADGADWSSVAHADGVNRVLVAAGAPARVSSTDIADLMLAHASGAYNAIAPYRGRSGQFRKRHRRRRRPRHGKVALGKPCGISPPGSPALRVEP